VLAVTAALVLPGYGCSVGGGARTETKSNSKSAQAKHETRTKHTVKLIDESGGFAASADWESFARTRKSLGAEIARRSEALRAGAVGNRAAELASLRMSAKAPALIDKGALDGAVELLERALSMDGGNGYAYLFLAYLNHVRGHSDQAAAFLGSARRYLPADKGVRGEVEGLARSMRASGPSGSLHRSRSSG